MTIIGLDYTEKKVLVGMTGRVDSAVAALLLKKQGMNVIGVSIMNHGSESSSSGGARCDIKSLERVQELCESMNIPFYAVDGESQFEGEVMGPLIASKLSALGDSSCLNCSEMRIKILYEKMKLLKADYIATGHFCKIHKNLNSKEYSIHSNNDSESDQSFLLSGVREKYLEHLLLPLGELTREDVVKIAKKFSLGASFTHKEKGFCFQNKNSYRDFATARVPKSLVKGGSVVNTDSGLFYGDHEGILGFSLGQRDLSFRGMAASDKDLEIIAYDFETGTLNVGSKNNLTYKGFQMVHVQMSRTLDRAKPIQCYLKHKHSKEYFKGRVFLKNNNTALVETELEVYPLIKGEPFVIYDRKGKNAKVIASGSVGSVGEFKLIDRALEFRSSEDDASQELTFKEKSFQF